MKRHVVLDEDVEDLIAPFHRKKGDLSRIINEALRHYVKILLLKDAIASPRLVEETYGDNKR